MSEWLLKIESERTANFSKLLLARSTWLARASKHTCKNGSYERLERLCSFVHGHCRDNMGDGFVDNHPVLLH